MSNNLLKLTLAVEPDRQRLARFILDAVAQLGGNVFAATAAVSKILPRLRQIGKENDTMLEIELRVVDDCLDLFWGDTFMRVCQLAQLPSDETMQKMAVAFGKASESTDPELLRRRNEKIALDLEHAKSRAATEMAELESALENKKRELQDSIRLAEIDGLTGILNRGAYDRRLTEAIRYSQRQHQALSLLIIDVDNFKEINDQHGHQHGDKFLRRTACIISAAVRREVDFACRIGGDEFAAIIYADLRVATRIAQIIIDGMDGTVSIGVAMLMDKEKLESFVSRTDSALYRAKEKGKGCCVTDDFRNTPKQVKTAAK